MDNYRKRLDDEPNEDEKYRYMKDIRDITYNSNIPDTDKFKMFEDRFKREIEKKNANNSLDNEHKSKSEKQKQ